MFKTEQLTIDVTFSIPQWFPPDRLDYSKAHYNPKGHMYEGSYDHSTYHNSAEDNLFNRFNKDGINEICSYYWIKFEYDGNPKQLSEWIEKMTNKLNKFFKQYKEGR